MFTIEAKFAEFGVRNASYDHRTTVRAVILTYRCPEQRFRLFCAVGRERFLKVVGVTTTTDQRHHVTECTSCTKGLFSTYLVE